MARAIARLRARFDLWSCARVGARPRVTGAIVVSGAGRVSIGDDFEASGWPLRAHLATGPAGVIDIGERVRVAAGASVYAEDLVFVGDDSVLGPFAMVLDVDFHEVRDRDARGEARPVRIGRRVHVGSGVVILRGSVIGDGAWIAPHSVVSRCIPPGARVAGVPARPVG